MLSSLYKNYQVSLHYWIFTDVTKLIMCCIWGPFRPSPLKWHERTLPFHHVRAAQWQCCCNTFYNQKNEKWIPLRKRHYKSWSMINELKTRNDATFPFLYSGAEIWIPRFLFNGKENEEEQTKGREQNVSNYYYYLLYAALPFTIMFSPL